MDTMLDELDRGKPGATDAAPEQTNGAVHVARRRRAAAIAAVALGIGALTAAGWRRTRIRRPGGRASPGRAPAGKDLAWSSPAVLADTPWRRFYDGRSVSGATTIEDLRAMAHRRLPRFVLEYLEGGADGEACLARNLEALAEWRFMHRSLVDVSRRDISTVLWDRRMAMPIVIAPTGLNGIMWAHADLRLAEAAAEAGIPFAQSTMSNDPMERVARVSGLRHWWQLYVFGPRDIREHLIDRAERAGCEALIVTTDAQIFGNREWAKRLQSNPTHLSWTARLDLLRHPRWLGERVLTHGLPRFENVIQFVPREHHGLLQSAHWIRSQMDRGLSWDTVAQIRDRWPRRLIVKGLLSVRDIEHAAEIGADAVAISNHGGRQLDWAVAPIDILPEARRAVGKRIALIVDGGMRRGTDILKALMLGADTVFVGRAALYGVAAAGRAGAKRALDIFREEIERDMGLLGVPDVAELDRRLLVKIGGGREAQPAEPY
ncbi:MAG: alpha-hydroxy acid oxidase [Alphaproteobacteria bacterium]